MPLDIRQHFTIINSEWVLIPDSKAKQIYREINKTIHTDIKTDMSTSVNISKKTISIHKLKDRKYFGIS